VPPEDVPAWLKSLRLHKYASLFSQMTYEEMMILTEHHLESQVYILLSLFQPGPWLSLSSPSPTPSTANIAVFRCNDTSSLNEA
jgi:hypothetical protein